MPAITSTQASPSLNRLTVPLPARSGDGGPMVEAKSTAMPMDAAKLLQQAPATPQEASKAAAKAPASAPSREEVERQVQDLQTKMNKLNPALAFVVDQDSGRAMIQLTDRATKEVILQFPTAAALQINKALDQFQKGQLVSRTV